MTDFDETNRGTLWKNKDKKEGDNRPDYTGKINMDGTEKRLAAWIKQGQNGKYMSLNVTDYQQQEPSDPLDDEVPGL